MFISRQHLQAALVVNRIETRELAREAVGVEAYPTGSSKQDSDCSTEHKPTSNEWRQKLRGGIKRRIIRAMISLGCEAPVEAKMRSPPARDVSNLLLISWLNRNLVIRLLHSMAMATTAFRSIEASIDL